MNYFGTSLNTDGHYTWNISNEGMQQIGLLPRDTPFNPEELTKNLPKGEVVFYQGGGYTVLGISGSCTDTRSGTKSIFWIKEIISRENMIRRVLEHNVAGTIISAFPFKVNWHN
jgi:hypothetical protein